MVDSTAASKHTPDAAKYGGDFTTAHGCSCYTCARKYAALPLHVPDYTGIGRVCMNDPYPMLDPPFAHDDEDSHPSNPFLFCPSHIYAFSLKHNSWRFVKIDALTDVDASHDLMESLIIPRRSKLLLDIRVDDLIDARNTWRTNLASSGLLVLLQGVSGTGKSTIAGTIILFVCHATVLTPKQRHSPRPSGSLCVSFNGLIC